MTKHTLARWAMLGAILTGSAALAARPAERSAPLRIAVTRMKAHAGAGAGQWMEDRGTTLAAEEIGGRSSPLRITTKVLMVRPRTKPIGLIEPNVLDTRDRLARRAYHGKRGSILVQVGDESGRTHLAGHTLYAPREGGKMTPIYTVGLAGGHHVVTNHATGGSYLAVDGKYYEIHGDGNRGKRIRQGTVAETVFDGWMPKNIWQPLER